ncbi:hypothetical protein CLV62_12578 [Dysgonomonas alginatilytica]|uniref:Uncharacterized protein n=1 Tax=Dysgonomonas alginatilytica TaxID=1605892 RepID=A0A2V3PKA6_9BACT|nr:hypothetical protein [Dysgonomonas alginatilytica]PXV61245.1 hypothetical protein CLV62_12578 [Dysgonomonas alginatilytica]
MKNLFIVLFLLFPILAFSQKIEKNEVDDFTGNKVIYTSWEKIKGGNVLTGRDNLMFMLRYENGTTYLHLKWITVEITSISNDAKLMFKFNDDSVATLNSISHVLSGKGEGVTGLSWSAIMGIHAMYKGDDIIKFSGDAVATKVRVYSTDGYVDIDIKDKDGAKINKAYSLLTAAIKK